ncbi:collagen alpha-1(II) chain [Elysia marginata]|uniref:Collagen alpha-1(II) chain n=1 Tax=Elysia marginata TaxID=1093978 RepID=A0AAV4HG19_9GAST|nr:collagen alpha-1(II) chain [Elysia marginata]
MWKEVLILVATLVILIRAQESTDDGDQKDTAGCIEPVTRAELTEGEVVFPYGEDPCYKCTCRNDAMSCEYLQCSDDAICPDGSEAYAVEGECCLQCPDGANEGLRTGEPRTNKLLAVETRLVPYTVDMVWDMLPRDSPDQGDPPVHQEPRYVFI